MAGASFILAINLVIAALFALAFLLVALTNRSDRVALWFALAYVFGIAYVFCEFILPTQSYAKLAYVVGFLAFLGAVTAVSIGITRRYNRPVPWLLIGLAVAGFGVVNWVTFDLERTSMVRMLGYQAPYAFMQALAAWVVLRSRRRQPIDLALMALFSLSALQFLSKPLVANLTGGTGDTAQQYLVSTYALYSQSLGAVLQVATGLVMLMLLVRDMLVDITAKSETDALSGLYNRRGFEERAVPLLAAARSDKVPVSIVIADLDAFKAINDTFGHDKGDEVIVAFARLIRDQAPQTRHCQPHRRRGIRRGAAERQCGDGAPLRRNGAQQFCRAGRLQGFPAISAARRASGSPKAMARTASPTSAAARMQRSTRPSGAAETACALPAKSHPTSCRRILWQARWPWAGAEGPHRSSASRHVQQIRRRRRCRRL